MEYKIGNLEQKIASKGKSTPRLDPRFQNAVMLFISVDADYSEYRKGPFAVKLQ